MEGLRQTPLQMGGGLKTDTQMYVSRKWPKTKPVLSGTKLVGPSDDFSAPPPLCPQRRDPQGEGEGGGGCSTPSYAIERIRRRVLTAPAPPRVSLPPPPLPHGLCLHIPNPLPFCDRLQETLWYPQISAREAVIVDVACRGVLGPRLLVDPPPGGAAAPPPPQARPRTALRRPPPSVHRPPQPPPLCQRRGAHLLLAAPVPL